MLYEDGEDRAVDRVKEIYIYMKSKGVCHSMRQFEQKLGVSDKYVSNSLNGRNKTGITTSLATRITDVFPEISLSWLVTGRGEMLDERNVAELRYKRLYELAMRQVDELRVLLEK